jgi:hypothetical protein
MEKIQLTRRDLLLFKFLHDHKVATVKQINRDLFRIHLQTLRKRIRKLKTNGWLASIKRGEDNDLTTIYSLTRKSFNHLEKSVSQKFCIQRFKSNSVEHDIVLVDIHAKLILKKFVKRYWTENFLQSCNEVTDHDKLSIFRVFQTDAVIYIENGKGNKLFGGIEYEASKKSKKDYVQKFTELYQNSNIALILYICKSRDIENTIKLAELEVERKKDDKKLYFVQLEEFMKDQSSVTFRSQFGSTIEIF